MSILVSVIVAAMPSAAMANWQYTNWGMSPAQVIAASHGSAHPGSGELSAQGDATKDVVGSFSAGARTFTAAFYFRAGKLSTVVLNSEGNQQCRDTARDLLSIYGQPVERSPGRMVSRVMWADQSKNNRVTFIVTTPGIGLYCELQYAPLLSEEAQSL